MEQAPFLLFVQKAGADISKIGITNFVSVEILANGWYMFFLHDGTLQAYTKDGKPIEDGLFRAKRVFDKKYRAIVLYWNGWYTDYRLYRADLYRSDGTFVAKKMKICRVEENGWYYLQDRCGNAFLYDTAGQEIVSVKGADIKERWIDAGVVNGMRFTYYQGRFSWQKIL
ncbi:MAG: hypothetical protein IJ479_04500 [Alphaproteobacteria bacterium]|nr:hypothetical protein [Alphaproteobacteria bacterium]